MPSKTIGDIKRLVKKAKRRTRKHAASLKNMQGKAIALGLGSAGKSLSRQQIAKRYKKERTAIAKTLRKSRG